MSKCNTQYWGGVRDGTVQRRQLVQVLVTGTVCVPALFCSTLLCCVVVVSVFNKLSLLNDNKTLNDLHAGGKD